MNAPAPHAASVPAQILHSMRDTFAPDVPEALRHAASALRLESASSAQRLLREAAWDTFAQLGVPGTKHEDYSYVSSADLKAALNRLPETSCEGPLAADALPSGARALTAFEFTEPGIAPWLRALSSESDAPSALALAFAPAPLFVNIPAGAGASSLPLRFTARGARRDYAVFVQVEAHASATLHLDCDADAEGFVNAAVFVSVGAGATVKILQHDTAAGVQLLKVRTAQERDSRVELLGVSTGSRLARLALEADLLAPGAEIDLRGAAAPGAQGRVHRHLRLRHASPDCRSSQLFKAVVPAAGRSSVDGTVTVDRGAQRTDARQLLQHLLLSPDARADAKPRLLIHADDVKCSHGATVGKTDPAQKFYLLSRGLDARTADRLLTQAFLNEALELFPEDATAGARMRLMDAVTGAAK
jgi:hypothetical protein